MSRQILTRADKQMLLDLTHAAAKAPEAGEEFNNAAAKLHQKLFTAWTVERIVKRKERVVR